MLYKNNRVKISVKFLNSLTRDNSDDATFLVSSLSEKMEGKKFIAKINKKRAINFNVINEGFITTIDGFLTFDDEHGVYIRIESMSYTKFNYNKLELTCEFIGLIKLPGNKAELVKFKGLNSSLDTELFSLLYFLNSKSLTKITEIPEGTLLNFQCLLMADHKKSQGKLVKTTSAIINNFTVIKKPAIAVN